jgi:hypothetical protein
MASVMTLALEAHHKAAPEVSFVQNFPGAVESGIARGSSGGLIRVLKTIYAVLGPLVHIPLVEAGDRHLFLCTSARYCAGPEDSTAGVPLVDGLTLARGTLTGKVAAACIQSMRTARARGLRSRVYLTSSGVRIWSSGYGKIPSPISTELSALQKANRRLLSHNHANSREPSGAYIGNIHQAFMLR